MTRKLKLYSTSFLTVYISSLLTLLSIFIYTMYVHYKEIDFDYLAHALVIINMISITAGLFGFIIYKNKLIYKIIYGCIIGFLLSVVYVVLFNQ